MQKPSVESAAVAHDKAGVHKHSRRAWIRTGVIVALIAISAAAVAYWMVSNNRVYVDSASIAAPVINLAPTTSGKLEQVFVNEGDEVPADTPVVQVGNELVKTKVAGIILSIPNQVGSLVNPAQTVVEMIDPTELRVVGAVDENKGLSSIAVGDRVAFTVDAFGGTQYSGIVDEVSPTSKQSGIVFNISGNRQTQQFNVKARFDTSLYPELKNGMSARMWIYTK